MSLFKPSAAPTLEERAFSAHAVADSALSVFSTLVSDLEAAADALDAVAEEAHAIADAHRSTADNASDGASARRTQAATVRRLFGEIA